MGYFKLIIAGIILSLFVFVFFLIKSYSTLKSQYEISRQMLVSIQKQQEIENNVILDVEIKQNEEINNQIKALDEMRSKGFIVTSDGLNPIWMRSPKRPSKK